MAVRGCRNTFAGGAIERSKSVARVAACDFDTAILNGRLPFYIHPAHEWLDSWSEVRREREGEGYIISQYRILLCLTLSPHVKVSTCRAPASLRL